MQIYSKEQRRKHLAEWKEFGISGKEYCRRKGIKPSTFYSWLKIEKHLEQPKKVSKDKSFVPVKITVPIRTSDSKDQVTLERDGFMIHVCLSSIERALPLIISAFGKTHVP